MVTRDKGEKTKDQSLSLDAIAVSQEDQSGKTPPITMENNNRPVSTMQLLRTEDGEGDARSPPIEEMITKLTEEIKKAFSLSEANQVSIREACEMLEAKFDLLANRTQILEEKEDVILIKQDLRQSRASEQDLQDKLERLENAARRNNLRIFNVPEGVEGDDIKIFIASLIKDTLQLEETEQDIAADIQRIHRDPFRRDPGRKKPRKILVNFLTYALKKKILLNALKQKTLRGKDFSFEVRSDLARSTLNRQWEIVLRILRSWVLQRNLNFQPPCG
ncbi:hypothetical protein NDU88_009540 [Pleurodeles waltl]|uniref:L1 transposable element RRM domain-containing protein n=1 Tax=Pleurodeles waltl TaxID=8319 RepID=A0AAV7S0N7_PLEWA|nr:hypothetical protein NDU88_009540 [Pleurodeles waltl]